jgi:hypothetical protein
VVYREYNIMNKVKVARFKPQDEFVGELYLQNGGLYFYDYAYGERKPNDISKLITINKLRQLIDKYDDKN